MKAILTGLLALLFLAGMAAVASGPAENDFKTLFAKHWQISKEFTLASHACHANDRGQRRGSYVPEAGNVG